MPNSEEQRPIPQSSDDEAPEEVSKSSSRIHALDIRKKERRAQQKLLEFKKRKRREFDAKLKEQKSKVANLSEKLATSNSKKEIDNIMKKINEEGLPKFLPTELLEDFANNDKTKRRRKQKEHTQVKLKMSKKKKDKEQPNTGPFTVVSLQDPDFNKQTPISKRITEFKEDHFYGERLPRKDAILNASQGRKGAAIRFCRK